MRVAFLPLALTANAAFIDVGGHRYDLDPVTQNTPLRFADQDLRPPPPRIPAVFDIFLGISAYRDGVRCGFTLFTTFSRATHPDRVHVGVVDQVLPTDAKCLDEYCKLAEAKWGECKFQDQIQIDTHDALKSTGPTGARHAQQLLIGDEEFCMELDAHSQLINAWDTLLVKDWARTSNEMAVLSTYPMGYEYIHEDDLTFQEGFSTHLCQHMRRGNPGDIPYTRGITLIQDSELPQMAIYFGGGLSFSKCHAEKRAIVDDNMKWLFYGEEYLRTFSLWSHGYDIYSPSRHGVAVFHNWTSDPNRIHYWKDTPQAALDKKYGEEIHTYARLRNILKLPFKGEVDMMDAANYSYGLVRTAEQFLDFTGISQTDVKLDSDRCNQLHWVPYARPDIVEAWVPGYHMHPLVNDTPSQVAQQNNQARAQEAKALHDQVANTHKEVEALKDAIAGGLKDQTAQLVKLKETLAGLLDDWKTRSEAEASALKKDRLVIQRKWADDVAAKDKALVAIQSQLAQLSDRSQIKEALPVLAVGAAVILVAVAAALLLQRRTMSTYHPLPLQPDSDAP